MNYDQALEDEIQRILYNSLLGAVCERKLGGFANGELCQDAAKAVMTIVVRKR